MENQIDENKIQESIRNWANMPLDIFTHVFAFLSMTDVVFNLSGVCRSWRKASADPMLWKTLDLELFTSKFSSRPKFNALMSKNQGFDRFKLFYESVVKGHCENLTKLIMKESLFFKDEHLMYVAERTPNLKFLVLPALPSMTERALAYALRRWPKLETISMSCFFYSPLILQNIGEICKNILALKLVNGLIDKKIALDIIKFLPGLKILMFRSRLADKEAVEILLDGLQNLEQFYISDKIFPDNSIIFSRTRLPIESEDITKKASRLKIFHVCQYGYCGKCPTAQDPDDISVIKES